MTGARRHPATDATREQRFLLACIGRTFDVDVRMPEGPINWASVLDLALDSGLASLLDTAVRALDAPMSADAADRLHALDTATRVRARYFVEPTMRRVLEALADRALQPIVVKGAALASTADADPAHRTFADLDILLLRDLEQARTLLEKAGFRPQGDQGADHHLPPLYADDGHVGVELHHDLLPRHSPYVLDLDGLVTRAQSAQVAGAHAWVAAPVDALHLACIHQSYAHRYRRYLLRGLTDLLALTTHYRSDFDWDLFLSIVKGARTAGAVYWPLRLARAWLNAPVPESVLDALAPGDFRDPRRGVKGHHGLVDDRQAPQQRRPRTRAVEHQPIDLLLLRGRAVVLAGRHVDGLVAEAALLPQDRQRAERVAALQRHGVVEHVQDAQAVHRIAALRRMKASNISSVQSGAL